MEEILGKKDYFVNKILFYWHGIPYTGSYRGLRFRISRFPMVNLYEREHQSERNDPNARLVVQVWPEPYAYEVTKKRAPETIESAEFSFDDAGIEECRCWLNKRLS